MLFFDAIGVDDSSAIGSTSITCIKDSLLEISTPSFDMLLKFSNITNKVTKAATKYRNLIRLFVSKGSGELALKLSLRIVVLGP